MVRGGIALDSLWSGDLLERRIGARLNARPAYEEVTAAAHELAKDRPGDRQYSEERIRSRFSTATIPITE